MIDEPNRSITRHDLELMGHLRLLHGLSPDGFKLVTTNGGFNGAQKYIYLAFAENPFGGSGVAQARAR
jgi:hypothetical protein